MGRLLHHEVLWPGRQILEVESHVVLRRGVWVVCVVERFGIDGCMYVNVYTEGTDRLGEHVHVDVVEPQQVVAREAPERALWFGDRSID